MLREMLLAYRLLEDHGSLKVTTDTQATYVPFIIYLCSKPRVPGCRPIPSRLP